LYNFTKLKPIQLPTRTSPNQVVSRSFESVRGKCIIFTKIVTSIYLHSVYNAIMHATCHLIKGIPDHCRMFYYLLVYHGRRVVVYNSNISISYFLRDEPEIHIHIISINIPMDISSTKYDRQNKVRIYQEQMKHQYQDILPTISNKSQLSFHTFSFHETLDFGMRWRTLQYNTIHHVLSYHIYLASSSHNHHIFHTLILPSYIRPILFIRI